MKNVSLCSRILGILVFVSVFIISGFSTSNVFATAPVPICGDSGNVCVTDISASQTFAEADNTFEHGWRWVFDVTVPNDEPILKMKFADWVKGSDKIFAANNIRFWSQQSSNVFSTSSAILITASSTYSSSMNLNKSIDLDTSKNGRQIQIVVEVKVPENSPGGSYSTSYGIQTERDTIKPIILLNSIANGSTTPITVEAGSNYVDAGATASDNIDGDITSEIITINPVNTSILNAYVVSYNVNDSAGNHADQKERVVNVTDTIAPMFTHTPLLDITSESTGHDTAVVLPTPGIIDAGDASPVITRTGPETFTLGTTTIVWRATDHSGNFSTTSQRVIIVDTTAPIITINPYNTEPTNQDITVTASANEGTLNTTSHTFTANSSFDFIATDESGNTATRTVTITNIDKVNPSVTYTISQTDISPNADGIKDSTDIGFVFSKPVSVQVDILNSTGVKVKDFYSNSNTQNPDPKNWDGTNDSSEMVPDGVYTIKVVMTDMAGNSVTDTSKKITVDTTKPIISSHDDVIKYVATHIGSNVNYNLPDIIDGDTSAIASCNPISGSMFNYGDTIVTCSATDKAGNDAIQTTFKVQVIDNVAPVITIDPYITTPTNQNITVTASVNEGTLNVTSHTFTSNGIFTFTATDEGGNTSSEIVHITNIDRVSPVITLLGAGNDGNPAFVIVGNNYTDAGATASDNIDGDITSKITKTSNVDTSVIRNGYVVTYSVSDSAGNTASVNRTVNVVPINQIITIGSSNGGSISALAPSGTNPRYIIVADPNHYISDVLVDGYSVLGQVGFDWITENTNAGYTFTNILSSHTISAVFGQIYSLTYVAGVNGSITGNLSQSVDSGSNGTVVTAVPLNGYHFVNWSDGISTASRTDTNVTQNISVTANFEINPIVPVDNIISDNINKDTTWTLADSPYHITKTVSVYPGTTLTIEPGVVVKANAETQLQIVGTLIARGNEDNLITFTSYEAGGSWGGIKFIDTANDAHIDGNYNYINGSVIEYADVNSGLAWDCIRIEGSSPFIAHSNIYNCANGIFIYNINYEDSSNAVIYSNTIGDIPTGYGIQQTNKVSDDGLVKIINNKISNTGTGIVSSNGQGPQLKDNIITNNHNGISLESSHDFLVENNVINIPSTSQETSIGMNINNSVGTVQHNDLSNSANTQPSDSALSLKSSNVTVRFNTITANSASTIRVNSLGGSVINSNNIYNTAVEGYAVQNWGNVDIDIANNYWDTTNSSEIDNKIYDFHDDPSVGNINYDPFANDPYVL